MTWGGSRVMSWSLKITDPESAGKNPVSTLKKVDLPAPLGPMIAWRRPGWTTRSTPSTARSEPKALVSACVRRSTACLRHPRSPRCGDTAEPLFQESQDASGQEEHADEQDASHEEEPVRGVADRNLVERREDRRPDHRPPEGPRAPEQGHQNRVRRLYPAHQEGRHRAVERREESAGQAREDSGDHEGGQPVPPDVDADELGAHDAVPASVERPPERRMEDPPEEPERNAHHDQGEVVVVIHRHQEGGRLDVQDAQVAPRQRVRLLEDAEHQLGEREREDGKVHAGQSHAEKAEDQGHEAPHHHRREHRWKHRHPELGHQEGCRVGADTVVTAVTERQEASAVEQEVKAHGEERHDQDLDRRVDDDGLGELRERQRHERQRYQPPPRSPEGAHNSPPPDRPRSPQGRTMRTTAMMMNGRDSAMAGMSQIPNAYASPMMKAASAVPGRLPNPPTITVAKARMMMSKSIPRRMPPSGAPIAPARPSTNTPAAKAAVNSQGSGLPRQATISRLPTAARIVLPSRVLCRKAQKPRRTADPVRTMKM